MNAKKHTNRAESTINDLEIEVQSLRERSRLLQCNVEENIDKKEKISRELEETLRVCDNMRNDLVILEDERNKLLSSIELLNNNNQNIEGDNRTFSVNINRLEIKLEE